MARREPKLVFRVHAARQMFKRGMFEADVRAALDGGEIIEDYPEDEPFPSRLVLGWVWFQRTRVPLHLVVSFDARANTIYLVTVYQPTLSDWMPGFRARKKKR